MHVGVSPILLEDIDAKMLAALCQASGNSGAWYSKNKHTFSEPIVVV